MNRSFGLPHMIASGVAIVLVTLPLLSCQISSSNTRAAAPANNDLVLFREIMQRVDKSYVEPVDDGKFLTDALKGALNGLDPHSDYMDEHDYQSMLSDTQGEFGGLGMELTVDHGMPKVISPIDDTPAARAGMQAGDLIPAVNGRSTDKMSLRDVVDVLRGPPGTAVTLSILRGEQNFELTLTRAIIQVVSVRAHLEPNKIGYARISTFGEKTQNELVDAIARLTRDAGGSLNGFVLDLRNDPGGLLDAAVEVSGDFLNGGTVVSIRGRDPTDVQAFTAPSRGDRVPGVPVVVLINGASASASEIVAGALQDEKRATIMGTRSFGKGSVQTIIPLHGRGALRLTTARYYTPSGRSIQDNGITPEVVIGAAKDAQVASGIAVHEADLRGALKNTGSLNGGPSANAPAGNGALPEAEEVPINPTVIGTNKDGQLAAALKYLHDKIAESGLPRRS